MSTLNALSKRLVGMMLPGKGYGGPGKDAGCAADSRACDARVVDLHALGWESAGR